MTARLRYDSTTNHVEKIVGRIIANELSFEVEVGDGHYGVKIKQDQADNAIVLHGSTLPQFIEALQEIHDLYLAAKKRYEFATSEPVEAVPERRNAGGSDA